MGAVLKHYLSAEGIRMCGCMLKRSPGADSAPMCRVPVHDAVSKTAPHVKVAADPGQSMAVACQLGACRTEAQALCLWA